MKCSCGSKSEKGQVLLLVFLLLILLGMIIGSAALMWELGLQSSGFESDSSKAFYIAEAGLNRGIEQFAASGGSSAGFPISGNLGEGSFSVSVSGGGTKRTFESTGWYRQARREVRSVLTQNTAIDCSVAPYCPPHGNAWGFHKKGQNDWTEQ